MADRAKPAFTPQECEAVQGRVHGGGSLLPVADHWPIRSAMSDLSGKFGVAVGRSSPLRTGRLDQHTSIGIVYADRFAHAATSQAIFSPAPT